MTSLPPGACDCHVHVIGARDRFPMVAERHYTPPEASADELRAHMARLGLQRAVVVQPSVYGSDNRCLLDSLFAFGGAARGVAVLDEAAGDDELDRLDAAGVRGLRLNVESARLRAPEALADALDAWASRIARLGWHLQVYCAFEVLAAIAPRLHALAVPLVLDHFAMLPTAAVARDDPRVRAVLRLLRDGPGYVKLSAPYRLAGSGAEIASLAHELVRLRPDRVLWSSDWPHTNREPGKRPLEVSRYRAIASDALRAELRAWLPDAATLQQVLVDNPARLYRF